MLQRQPYRTHRLARDRALVYTARGSAEVTSPALIDLLEELAGEAQGLYAADDLRVRVEAKGLPPAAIDFLKEELLVLQAVPSATWQFERVRLLAPDRAPNREMRADLEAALQLPVELAGADDPVAERQISVLVLERYDAAAIRALYRAARDRRNAVLVTAYVLDRFFMIDGVYVPGAFLPCHFCHVERQRTLARRGRLDRVNNWFAFFDHLQSQGIGQAAGQPLSGLERALLYYTLGLRLRAVLAREGAVPFPLELLSYTQVSLEDGAVERDAVPLWDACACLANAW
jgi:McbB family protein